MTARWVLALLLLTISGCSLPPPPVDPANIWHPPQRTTIAGLTRDDELLASAAMMRALNDPRTDVPVAWRKPASRNSGSITAREAFQASTTPNFAPVDSPNALICRSFEEKVTARGREQSVRGLACRVSDQWQLTTQEWRKDPPNAWRATKATRLAEVARQTKVPVAALLLANPNLKDPVSAHTVVLVPTAR